MAAPSRAAPIRSSGSPGIDRTTRPSSRPASERRSRSLVATTNVPSRAGDEHPRVHQGALIYNPIGLVG
ncbi:hypothetical protein ASE16_18890 [Leifsonia sp. Root227]|uniref:hypothetical protein n=1 Tax=Leifsonia sp. Root227 TaxID=1736496 RepID=UPI0006FD22CA|nr:hypothetical protein [Leifsonia sp. Root227]KRC47364.1 hypothetical protein ASE16_18890 [Leifsonia sp. Root227]